MQAWKKHIAKFASSFKSLLNIQSGAENFCTFHCSEAESTVLQSNNYKLYIHLDHIYVCMYVYMWDYFRRKWWVQPTKPNQPLLCSSSMK